MHDTNESALLTLNSLDAEIEKIKSDLINTKYGENEQSKSMLDIIVNRSN